MNGVARCRGGQEGWGGAGIGIETIIVCYSSSASCSSIVGSHSSSTPDLLVPTALLL